ncbi:MAG: transglutaminase-like domain-containing protein [Gemmatimonadetes bacterium]|nr:transglutaminase-like domain-containing protein [Gemmatimonadota bacterium]
MNDRANSSVTHSPFIARERRRSGIAVVVVMAWMVGLAVLGRRELFVGSVARLAEAALRVNPGATYFSVDQNGSQIGFASTTIDTTETGIDVVDYFVADLPVGGTVQRSSARSLVQLSRGLALRSFDVSVDAPGAKLIAGGRTDGDSGVVYMLSANGEPADSQRIAVRGPILLPQLVPLAAMLTDPPKIGRNYTFPTFDPTTMEQRPMRLTVRAESVFTLVDSAAFDPAVGIWISALTDTVRAWKIEPDVPGSGFSGWVDAQGRVVETTQPGGITLRRMAYELAFENWRIARQRNTAANAGTDDISESTAIASNVSIGRGGLTALVVRLTGVDLRGYALDGGRQSLSGDTLSVGRDAAAALIPAWSFGVPRDSAFRARFRAELAAEPLLQKGDPRMVQQAIRIVGLERDPRAVAEKLTRWVHDSLTKEVVFSVPNAIEILRTRRGDCNEHTQLYVALARAIGLPARIATGLAYVRGKFYYHAWPEVWLADWVAVDPTFGQFPADAAHLRFQVGGLVKQAELLRLIGNLRIDVVEAK